MVSISCDGSYKDRMCGIAAAIRCQHTLPQEVILPVFKAASDCTRPAMIVEDNDFYIIAAAFYGKSNNAAETAALGLAVMIARFLVVTFPLLCTPIGVWSDSRNAIQEILSRKPPRYRETLELRRIVEQYPILISKTGTRCSDEGNRIADRWAEKARKGLTSVKEDAPHEQTVPAHRSRRGKSRFLQR